MKFPGTSDIDASFNMRGQNSPANSVLHARLAGLIGLQNKLSTQPYSIILRLKLAKAYKYLGYPDLAAGDAYKALLLIDEVVEELEFHDEALGAAKVDIASIRASKTDETDCLQSHDSEHIECCCRSVAHDDQVRVADDDDDEEAVTWAKTCWSKTAYDILIGGLIACGCLRSAFDYNSRALRTFPRFFSFESYRETLVLKLRSHFESTGENFDDIDVLDYPDQGLVRREVYPWNEYEPDRFSPESIQFLNEEMANVAPQLEVKVVNLPLLSLRNETSSGLSSPDQQVHYVKQLGVFAKQNIPPGEQILQEKSLLTAVSRLHESYCDACSALLPTLTDLVLKSESSAAMACEDCDEAFFCSKECHDLAQAQYHPAICGMSMEQKVPATEAADYLYSLLLVRAMALAEAQDVHPLKLNEVRYIWGDYHALNLDHTWQVDDRGRPIDPFASVPQTLPFSFNHNILTPLNVLEKMDVNIFEQSHRYDTWVFNTLYGKFRGTASARQGLDGRPEIAAVHPMWCLTNHSCDPNVAWEWQGSIKFWTREKLVDWKGRDPKLQPGVLKGEEMFSHYCDIRLPVKERREWAVGALGGDCMCARCVWEESEEKTRKDIAQ